MDRFEAFCADFQKLLTGDKEMPEIIGKGRDLVSELSATSEWFFDRLAGMILDPDVLKRQKPGIWPNEYSLYRNPDRSFVVLAYVWDVGVADTVHDHGSWGVIGTITGELGENKYQRLDDGTRESFADIRQTTSERLGPGRTTFVLPLDEGIHAMCNSGRTVAASVNVYGRSIGRGYAHFFDPARKTVTRAFPPRSVKELLALKALSAMDPSRAESVLTRSLELPRPAGLRQEYEKALRKLRE